MIIPQVLARREMIERLRGIEDACTPRSYGNLVLRGRLRDGWAMLHGVDPCDFESDELDDQEV